MIVAPTRSQERSTSRRSLASTRSSSSRATARHREPGPFAGDRRRARARSCSQRPILRATSCPARACTPVSATVPVRRTSSRRPGMSSSSGRRCASRCDSPNRWSCPMRKGKPFRVDVVLFDPDVPAVDAGLYRGVNRILRYDAVRDPVTSTLLVPEAGQSRFIATDDRRRHAGDAGAGSHAHRRRGRDRHVPGTRAASLGRDRARRGRMRPPRRRPAHGAASLAGRDGPPGPARGRGAAARQDALPLVPWFAGSFVVLAASAYLVLRRRDPR